MTGKLEDQVTSYLIRKTCELYSQVRGPDDHLARKHSRIHPILPEDIQWLLGISRIAVDPWETRAYSGFLKL